jgi:hypothetical protein
MIIMMICSLVKVDYELFHDVTTCTIKATLVLETFLEIRHAQGGEQQPSGSGTESENTRCEEKTAGRNDHFETTVKL